MWSPNHPSSAPKRKPTARFDPTAAPPGSDGPGGNLSFSSLAQSKETAARPASPQNVATYEVETSTVLDDDVEPLAQQNDDDRLENDGSRSAKRPHVADSGADDAYYIVAVEEEEGALPPSSADLLHVDEEDALLPEVAQLNHDGDILLKEMERHIRDHYDSMRDRALLELEALGEATGERLARLQKAHKRARDARLDLEQSRQKWRV